MAVVLAIAAASAVVLGADDKTAIEGIDQQAGTCVGQAQKVAEAAGAVGKKLAAIREVLAQARKRGRLSPTDRTSLAKGQQELDLVNQELAKAQARLDKSMQELRKMRPDLSIAKVNDTK